MSTPIERVSGLIIGRVESVAPGEIEVKLEPEAPQATAMSTGTPRPFPRINGHVLIPNETGAVVGVVVWVGAYAAPAQKGTPSARQGMVDLPFPERKLKLSPVGTLVTTDSDDEEAGAYELQRGVRAFPCVGDPVLLPTDEQLLGILQAGDIDDQRVTIGTSPLAADAPISVDPDKLFGRHLAVLGNTGSGKSCSVAGLIRWCLAAASEDMTSDETNAPNARFIVLDVNGEYVQAFKDLDCLRVFQVGASEDTEADGLVVPAWMWDSREWTAFARAAPQVQTPLLRRALRDMRAGATIGDPVKRSIRRDMLQYHSGLQGRLEDGIEAYGRPRGCHDCGREMKCIAEAASDYAGEVEGVLSELLAALSSAASELETDKRYNGGYNAFGPADLRPIIGHIGNVLECAPGSCSDVSCAEDAPIQFSASELPRYLEQIASEEGGRTGESISTLRMRIRMMLEDGRLGPIINPAQEGTITLVELLNAYLGVETEDHGTVTVIDLSLVPSDILHTVVSVVARIVFEALQRYRKLNDHELPTVLVLEEAHSFVRRGNAPEDNMPTPEQTCRGIFERIAREGRKFGLGLVVSSQRPSELSPTVLAQCNTFLLHRVVNDRDQQLLSHLVPDSIGGLLGELPSLPTQQAILLGWASRLPKLIEMTELPRKQRPRSDDPHYWNVWTRREERAVDWSAVEADWTSSVNVIDDDAVETDT